MKTDFFHLDLVCTECIRGYGNWGYNDWNRWREEQGMLCRCLNFSYLPIVFSKDESRNMRRMPDVKFHLRRNDITIIISSPFQPISTDTSNVDQDHARLLDGLQSWVHQPGHRLQDQRKLVRFWVTRPSLISSSATTIETNIIVSRNNLNFKITS